MKSQRPFILILLMLLSFNFVTAQDKNKDNNNEQTAKLETFNRDEMLKDYADKACKCIDSIRTGDKTTQLISEEIAACIDKQVLPYQIIEQMTPSVNNQIKKLNGEKDADTLQSSTTIVIAEKGSEAYDKYYRKIENYLMENCPAIKSKVATRDELMMFGVSKNEKAVKWFTKGVDAAEAGNLKKAIKYYKKALKIDADFPFAWDNLGLAYRKTGQYDKALKAYAESMKLLPGNKTPVQNSAVVYTYLQDWDKAIEMYNKLIQIDPDDPESYYGIGQVLTAKKDYEKALDNLCKAYNIYIDMNSPYRSDAEKLINYLYQQFKKDDKEDVFKEILKKNHIKVSEE